MDHFNWDDLRFFLSVARAGRLTTAARRLGADHATVSRRITALEKSLQAKLFERSPQGYALTTQGDRLLERAEAIEAQAMKVSTEIAGSDMSLSGTVRIGCPDGVGTFFLATRLPELSKQFPGLEIQLSVAPRQASYSKRDADIVIALTPPKEGRVTAQKLGDFTLGFYASRDYVQKYAPIETVKDLEVHTIIGYIDDLSFTPDQSIFHPLIEKLGERLSSSSLIVQMQMAIGGGGICMMPHFVAATDPRLVPILPDQAFLKLSYWLLIQADQQEIARIRTVADFVSREIKSSQSVFLPTF